MNSKVYKAKDTPWDAVLMGSVVCTVTAKVLTLYQHSLVFIIIHHFLTV